VKATSASFSYGRGAYPVHESNLPDVEIEEAIQKVLKHMAKLSGGFELDQPDFINLEVIGNGYTVRLNYENPEFYESLKAKSSCPCGSQGHSFCNRA